MANFLMQAVDSDDGEIYTWNAAIADFAGDGYPGPNDPEEIAVVAVNGDAAGGTSGSGAATSTNATSYTFALADANRGKHFTAGTTVTATVPPNATVPFPVGTRIPLLQLGAGQVQVAQGVGVTVNKRSVYLRNLAGQYAPGCLEKTDTNTWALYGDLELA